MGFVVCFCFFYFEHPHVKKCWLELEIPMPFSCRKMIIGNFNLGIGPLSFFHFLAFLASWACNFLTLFKRSERAVLAAWNSGIIGTISTELGCLNKLSDIIHYNPAQSAEGEGKYSADTSPQKRCKTWWTWFLFWYLDEMGFNRHWFFWLRSSKSVGFVSPAGSSLPLPLCLSSLYLPSLHSQNEHSAFLPSN